MKRKLVQKMKKLLVYLVLLSLMTICQFQDRKPPSVIFGIIEDYFTEDLETFASRKKGYMNFVEIKCQNLFDPLPHNLPYYQPTTPLHIIYIENCLLPEAPLEQVFDNYQFNTKQIDKLVLKHTSVPPNGKLTLNIKNLVMINVTNARSDFFALSPSFQRMAVEDMEMPQLPLLNNYLMRPKGLKLRNTSIKKWLNCEKLIELDVSGVTKEGIPEEWPKNCSQLSALLMYSLPQDAVKKFVDSAIYNNVVLSTIVMKNCSLEELPAKLMRNKRDFTPDLISYHNDPYFERLDFSDNNIEDEAFSQIPSIVRQLKYLILSNNRLTGGFSIYVHARVTAVDEHESMQELNLDGNIVDLSSNYSIKKALVKMPLLKQLSLNRMDLDLDCLMHTYSYRLERLNLQPSQPKTIEHLKLYGFPKTDASKELTVDLRGISVKYVSVGPTFTEDFDNMDRTKHWFNNTHKLRVLMDAVDCDCNNDVLVRALHKYPQYLSMPALKCTHGGLFLNEPMENLDCRKATVDRCTRKINRRDETVVVDCSKSTEKLRWPKPNKFKGLNVSGRNVTALKNAYLPDSLEWIDLRNNNISTLDRNDLAKLFSTPHRRVWLNGNPIHCHCDNAPFIKFLQSRESQIADYGDIKCSDNIVNLYQISLFEICKTGKQVRRFFMSVRPEERIEKSFDCPSQLEDKKTWDTKISAHAINIHNCNLSPTPLVDVIKKLNISIDKLDSLHFADTTFYEPLPENYMSELSVPNIKLTNTSSPKSFFKALRTDRLYTITIENMVVPAIPKEIILQYYYLFNASVKNWDNCVSIQKLTINSMDVNQIPKVWPETCARLKYLKLESLSNETVQHVDSSINNIVSLVELRVHNCGLTDLPWKLIDNTERVENLDFSANQLDDNVLNRLPVLYNLKTLDLSKNRLVGNFLLNFTNKVPELKVLKLDDNLLVHTFNNFEIKSAIVNLVNLKQLSLNRMTLEPDCFMHTKFRNLMYLDMISNSDTSIKVFKLYSLPTTSAQSLDVDLRGRPFGTIVIDKLFFESFDDIHTSHLWLTSKGYKLNIQLDSVDCDCNNDILAQSLKEFPGFLYMGNVRCNQNYGLLSEQPLTVLNCKKATIHGCRRKMSRHFKYVTTVDCSNNAEKFLWPQPERFQSLNASGNHIKSIHKAYLPESLLWLDLSMNDISRLDNNETAKLLSSPERRIWLAHNPIACECSNRDMIIALQTNHSQIMDYDLVQCEGTNQPIRLVSVEELCRAHGPEAAWVSVSVLAVLIMVIGLLLRHYWTSLQMVLYSRGCCLSCLSEEEIDQDRLYDAFLSFAHGDDEYVMEKLLPRLEGAPNYYRVCVHYRDWLIGDWIPAQIMRSVRASKRTIIILSQNFVRSWWGVLEFRYAHANAMSEGRSRLLVLILDDVLSEDLTPELQGYLDLNTYLRCDDPWFWEKLQYAMPHFKDKSRSPPTFSDFRGPIVSYPSSDIPLELAIEANHSTDNVQRSASLNQSSEEIVIQPDSLLALPEESSPMQDMIDWFSDQSSLNLESEEAMPSLIAIDYNLEKQHSAQEKEGCSANRSHDSNLNFIDENITPVKDECVNKTLTPKESSEVSEPNNFISIHETEVKDLDPFIPDNDKERYGVAKDGVKNTELFSLGLIHRPKESESYPVVT